MRVRRSCRSSPLRSSPRALPLLPHVKYTCLVCDDVRPIRGPLQANAFKHAFFESLFETGTAKLSKKRKAEGMAHDAEGRTRMPLLPDFEVTASLIATASAHCGLAPLFLNL